ncbi:hypothetical protein GCM10027186_02520 [Micromonospora schwarzwaldensis]
MRRENNDLKCRLAVQQTDTTHPNTTLGLNAAPRPCTPIDAVAALETATSWPGGHRPVQRIRPTMPVS